MKASFLIPIILAGTACAISAADAPAVKRDYQYKTERIFVPAASADEPKVKSFGPESIRAAAKYMDDGAITWTEEKSCIACHTNGSYMSARPGLTAFLGKPAQVVVDNFIATVPAAGQQSKGGAQGSVWRSVGLAEYDKHVTGSLSAFTDTSLRDMFAKQTAIGCWPTGTNVEIPHITTDFELTVKAAQAAATAPGWIAGLQDAALQRKVGLLKSYLREAKPRNDYECALKLQVAALFPGLIPESVIKNSTDLLWRLQHEDGSWSLRDMSEITNWRDNMNAKQVTLLQGEPDAAHPVGDAYMTGFAIELLRGVDVPADDARIRRGIGWLKSTQRVSGRWWMKSLYSDNIGSWHFSTYIATTHAMKALAACGELAALNPGSQASVRAARP